MLIATSVLKKFSSSLSYSPVNSYLAWIITYFCQSVRQFVWKVDMCKTWRPDVRGEVQYVLGIFPKARDLTCLGCTGGVLLLGHYQLIPRCYIITSMLVRQNARKQKARRHAWGSKGSIVVSFVVFFFVFRSARTSCTTYDVIRLRYMKIWQIWNKSIKPKGLLHQ